MAAPDVGTLTVRPLQESDRPFVLDSWNKSYAQSRTAQRLGPRYYHEQERIGRWCIAHEPVLVGADADLPDVVLGWACGRPGTVHYVYVASGARKRGIARLLLGHLLGQDARAVRMTHKPPPYLRAKIPPTWFVMALSPSEMTL